MAMTTFAAADAAAFAGAAAPPIARSPHGASAGGRFVRAVGKRVRAEQRAQRAATTAAAALLATELEAGECSEAIASLSAAAAKYQRRLDALQAQRHLFADLAHSSPALRVAAEHLCVSLGPNAVARLRLCGLETRVALLGCHLDLDAERRRSERLRRQWAKAYDALQRRLLRLRVLRRRRGPPLVEAKIRLDGAMRI